MERKTLGGLEKAWEKYSGCPRHAIMFLFIHLILEQILGMSKNINFFITVLRNINWIKAVQSSDPIFLIWHYW